MTRYTPHPTIFIGRIGAIGWWFDNAVLRLGSERGELR